MMGNSLKIYWVNFIVIGLVLSFLYVLPALAQPTSLRQFRGSKQLIQVRIEEATKITSEIEKDKSNLTLYKKRLFLNGELLVLSEDTDDWNIYADKYEADLSNIIELEKTARNYDARGRFLIARLNHLSVANVSDLYPHNRYIDMAASDFLNAIQLTAPQLRQTYYSNLNLLYRFRPQKLISAPNFSKWKALIPYELVRKDFDLSVKYGQLALEGVPNSDLLRDLKKQLVITYLSNADVAARLGDSATALKFTQAAQKYRE